MAIRPGIATSSGSEERESQKKHIVSNLEWQTSDIGKSRFLAALEMTGIVTFEMTGIVTFEMTGKGCGVAIRRSPPIIGGRS